VAFYIIAEKRGGAGEVELQEKVAGYCDELAITKPF
jgi:hypothetical protein